MKLDRATLRPALVQALIAVAVLVVVGAVAGVIWQWVWTPPSGAVVDHTWTALDEASLRGQFTGTGWYVVVGSVAGLVGGLLVSLVLARSPLFTLLGVVVGSALGAWVMYLVGTTLGPDDPVAAARTAKEGTHLPAALTVSGVSPFIALPTGALVALALVFIGLSATHRSAETDSSS